MIKEQQVTFGGITFKNVLEVSVHIDTPSDGRGFYREPTFAATITIVRDASDHAYVDAFGLATNADGRKNMLTDGTLEFHGDDVKDSYSFNIKKAFISHWSLENPTSPNSPTLETIELKVGDLEFNGGGASAHFALPNFA